MFAVRPANASRVCQPADRSITCCTICVSGGSADRGKLAADTIVGSNGLHRRSLWRPRRQKKIGEEASLARPGIARGVNLPGAVGPSLSGPIEMFLAGVSQRDLAFEHEVDRLATMRVPGGPRARREVHDERYQLRLPRSIRDVEPRLGDDRAFADTASSLAEGGEACGRRDRENQTSSHHVTSWKDWNHSLTVPSQSWCRRFRAWKAHGSSPSAP